ncbi:glutamate racemase [Candidatus Allofournierella merdipullorum]|uniref:glutamate racemase n=1 Tax=Candidatus Allofournierella merdipullorum TaxID=2838595 RepID=UPI003AB2291B
MDERAIGVFDSGAGGLTAVRQLRRLLPGEKIVYFGDTGRVPYGTRSPSAVFQYAKQDIAFLLSKNVKFLLAACGTVSSILPADYTAALPVPFAGVVDAASAAAAAATKNGRIGVIGTSATIRSGSYEQRLHNADGGFQVFAKACPMFVPLVENGYVAPDDPVTAAIARQYLEPLRGEGVDTLILGCTHYPLIAPAIAKVMGPEVTLIDAGREGALLARRRLSELDLLAPEGSEGGAEYFVSDEPAGFEPFIRLFVGANDGPVTRVAIDNY